MARLKTLTKRGLASVGRVGLAILTRDELIDQLAIAGGPQVPAGVMARQIDPSHILYLNLDGKAKRIELKDRAYSILSDRKYEDSFILDPFEPEFLEFQQDSIE